MSPIKRKPAVGATGSHVNGMLAGNSKTDDSAKKPSKQERWRQRNPVATWAHSATRSAIRRGIIQPRPCSVCGHPKAEAHHPDHRDPLRVIWLCRQHHKAEHRRMKAEACK